MKNIKYTAVGLALACVGMQAHAAGPELVTNGSFEANAVPGLYTTYGVGTGITGWKVVVGNVDLVSSTLWGASAGNNSVDLNGTRKGFISQTITTVAGQIYQLSFDLAGNFQGGPAVKEMSVTPINNGTFTFDTTNASAGNMGWTHYATTFIAQSASTVLSFGSNKSGSWGPALDNVSVTAVPEPETLAMMLAGLGLMGSVVRRRKRAD